MIFVYGKDDTAVKQYSLTMYAVSLMF